MKKLTVATLLAMLVATSLGTDLLMSSCVTNAAAPKRKGNTGTSQKTAGNTGTAQKTEVLLLAFAAAGNTGV